MSFTENGVMYFTYVLHSLFLNCVCGSEYCLACIIIIFLTGFVCVFYMSIQWVLISYRFLPCIRHVIY